MTKKDISRKTVQKEEDTIEEMIVENLSHMEEKNQADIEITEEMTQRG